MCEESDFPEGAGNTGNWRWTRREFGAAGGAVALAACSSGVAGEDEGLLSAGIAEDSVTIETPDGLLDAFFVHPATGSSPAVIFWPDIASIRDSKRMMARRLAGEGYAVLVVNPYYRDVAGEQFESSVAFRAEGGFQTVEPWRDKLSSDAIMRDADAIVSWLDEQDAVDTVRGIGTQGYCMGGPFAVYSAHARPDRIRAAASFHGGGLVREDPHSPHRLIADTPETSYIFAIAKNDHARTPDDKDKLAAAVDEYKRDAQIEVYAGDHGWTVPETILHTSRLRQSGPGASC
ncbi:dienelactone hydrolase family protein [Parerythrobacter jejuensis]|uniref:dienelactone hydrolase family protein n=1 Tax=Parerythrobacter jejuensis TaxID=795812 RepID=UPI002D7E2B07|nr:dienelactone hydrolase family protein [Parerythrobacter jejuensis]